MSSARDIVQGALKLLGLFNSADSMTAEEAADGLTVLNDLLSSWNTENHNVYNITRSVFALTPATQQYTLGSGGTLNMTRPARVSWASIIPVASSPNTEIPIDMLDDKQWQETLVKSITGPFPVAMYLSPDMPLMNLYFWPIPTAACSVVLYSWGLLSAFSTLSDTVSFPPGYERALKFNLAVDMAPMYGLEASPTVQRIAMQSKYSIRLQNWDPTRMSVDNALLAEKVFSDVAVQSRGRVVD